MDVLCVIVTLRVLWEYVMISLDHVRVRGTLQDSFVIDVLQDSSIFLQAIPAVVSHVNVLRKELKVGRERRQISSHVPALLVHACVRVTLKV
jgi:hypothetical protein